MITPWADNLAKRTAESEDLLSSSNPRPKTPSFSPPPIPATPRPIPTPPPQPIAPIQSAIPVPTLTPQPIAPPEPNTTPFMDRMLKKAGATALDFLVSQGDQTVNALGNASEFALGSRNPLDIPGNFPEQATDAFKEAMYLLNSTEEVLKTFIPTTATLAGEAFDFGTAGAPYIGDARRAVGIEPPNLQNFSRRLEENEVASEASQGILKKLVQGKISPREAELALSDIYESRPMTTQIATSPLDLFAAPGIARAAVKGIRGARAITQGSLVNPIIAQAAGREPFEQVLEALLKARNHGEARRIIADADPSNFPALREAIDTMDPKLAAVHRAKVALDIPLTPAEQTRMEREALGRVMNRRDPSKPPTPQVPPLEGMTPLGLADETLPTPSDRGLQRGFESVSDDFTPEGQSKLFDVETAPGPAPLIDPAELSIQATERARLADEAVAGQQGLPSELLPDADDTDGLARIIDEMRDVEAKLTPEELTARDLSRNDIPIDLGETTDFGRSVEVRTEISRDVFEWRPATIERILNQGDMIEVRLPESNSTVRLPATDVRRIQGDPAQTLIARITADKRPQGGLNRGLQAYERDLKGLTSEELQTVLEWTRTQDDWIRRFVGSNVDAEIRSRGPLDIADEVPLVDDVVGVVPTTPIRFDPATNNYNVPLQRGDLLTDELGNVYRLERQSGFILEVDAQRPNGSFAPFGSFSVDPGDVDHYRPLFKEITPTGITPDYIPPPAAWVPEAEAAAPTPAVGDFNTALNKAKETGNTPKLAQDMVNFRKEGLSALRIGYSKIAPREAYRRFYEVQDELGRSLTRTELDELEEGVLRELMEEPGAWDAEALAKQRSESHPWYLDAPSGYANPNQEFPYRGLSPEAASVTPEPAAAPSPADEIQQILDQREIDEAGLSTVELAELRLEEAQAINTALGSQKIFIPPPTAGLWGFNRDMLIEIAQQEGRDPTKPDWWDAMDKVLIRSFRKEHSSGGARSRVRKNANAKERLAREELEQAHIDAGKSHDAAVKAADAPVPNRKLKTPVKDPTVTSLLPDDLRKATPNYKEGQRPQQRVTFEDDLDKALYIVARTPTPEKPGSKHDSRYLAWIKEVTGMDTFQARAQGKLIRAEIKKLYTGDQETPIFLKSTVTRPKIKPPIPKPIPNQAPLTLGEELVMNGVDSFLADSQSVKGFRYDEYSPLSPETDPRATIRVINESTGEITIDRQFDSLDEAMNAYDDMLQAAHKPGGGGAEVPPTTETGRIDSFPPDGPPPVNAAGEPFSEDPEDIIAWFKRWLADPARAEEMKITLEWRRRAQTGRMMEAREYESQLVAGGMEPGEASFKSREKLSGSFARPQTSMGLQEIAGPEVRTALYNKVSYFFREGGPNDEGWELQATLDALKNALQQKAIPDIPGSLGRSAKTRLVRVFGDEIVEALDTPQDLETIIATRQERTVKRSARSQADLKPGEEGTPSTIEPSVERYIQQEEDALIRGQQSIDEMKAEVTRFFGPNPEANPNPSIQDSFSNRQGKIRSAEEALQRRSDELQAIRAEYQFHPIPDETMIPTQMHIVPEEDLPGPRFEGEVDRRPDYHKKLDLLEFGKILRKKYSKFPDSTNRISHPTGEIPPEMWIQQWELMPDPDRHLLMRAAKFAGLNLMDFGNFLKANLASVDFSFWRQQQPLIFGNLDAFAKGNIQAFKSIWTQAYAEKVMADINSHPDMAFIEELDIDFLRPLNPRDTKRIRGAAEIDQPGGRIGTNNRGVEEFGLFGGDRPIQRLTAALPWVRISGRAHITGTNAMNWKIFTTFMEQQRKVSRGIAEGKILLKPGETFDIKREAKLMGTMLEDMSGRAQLPETLTKLTPAMNAGFFSMRLNMGRLIMGRHLFSKSPAVRKAAIKNLVTSVLGFSGIIFAGKQQGLWDVELDYRSSDFMSIRIGKIRIDPWGGARQFVTFLGRMLPIAAAMETFNIPGADKVPQAGLKSTTTGQVTQGYGSNTMRLARSKASPLATLVIDTWTGKDFLGDPVDNTDISQWAERMAPLAVQDIYEAFQEQGGWSASASAAAIVGAGVIVYDLPRWPDLDEYYMIKATKLQSTQKRRSEYRRRNALQEARLFVRGDVTTLSSTRARNLVLDIMSEHDVDPKDVKGYSKVFKDKPVPEGRSVRQEEKDRLKANQDRIAGRSTSQQSPSISVQEELNRLADIAAGDPVLTK